MSSRAAMTPVGFREDAASRRWLAARAMRVPLVLIKFGTPVLMIAALAIIVRQPNLAAQPLDVLYALALPFALPFLIALIYPFVRWMPQEWRLDAAGIHGSGRVSGTYPWDALVTWTITPAASLPDVFHVVFRRAPTWQYTRASMMVPTSERRAVEAWFGASGPSHPTRPAPAG